MSNAVLPRLPAGSPRGTDRSRDELLQAMAAIQRSTLRWIVAWGVVQIVTWAAGMVVFVALVG